MDAVRENPNRTAKRSPFRLVLRLPKLPFNFHSYRVRRKRQRLPSSLLIENASAEASIFAPTLCAEAFRFKANDYTSK